VVTKTEGQATVIAVATSYEAEGATLDAVVARIDAGAAQ
jgi:hypothetical protein